MKYKIIPILILAICLISFVNADSINIHYPMNDTFNKPINYFEWSFNGTIDNQTFCSYNFGNPYPVFLKPRYPFDCNKTRIYIPQQIQDGRLNVQVVKFDLGYFTQSVYFKIDSNSPTINAPKIIRANKPYQLNISVADDYSGVDELSYYWVYSVYYPNVSNSLNFSNYYILNPTISGRSNLNQSYWIDFGVFDKVGNVALKRILFIWDDVKPKITLNGNESITLNEGDTYIELNATAWDDYNGNCSINITSNLDMNNNGTYEIIYSASDGAGNIVNISRYVIVKDVPVSEENYTGSSKSSSKCETIWDCGVWSECINGYMTRTCYLSNDSCEINIDKPSESLVCKDYSQPIEEVVNNTEEVEEEIIEKNKSKILNYLLIALIILIFLSLIIGSLIYYFKIKKPKKENTTFFNDEKIKKDITKKEKKLKGGEK